MVQMLTREPDVSSELERLVEQEEEEAVDGPEDADRLAVVAVDAPLDPANLHLLLLDQDLANGDLRMFTLRTNFTRSSTLLEVAPN